VDTLCPNRPRSLYNHPSSVWELYDDIHVRQRKEIEREREREKVTVMVGAAVHAIWYSTRLALASHATQRDWTLPIVSNLCCAHCSLRPLVSGKGGGVSKESEC
jgi:hypothetical protein